MARLGDPIIAPTPPIPPQINLAPVVRDPENPGWRLGYAPPAPPPMIYMPPPMRTPAQNVFPDVSLSQSGVSQEWLRGGTQVGTGPQARLFAASNGLHPAAAPEQLYPIGDPNVQSDFTSTLNHYWPYDNTAINVPPQPPRDLFVPTARIDGPLGAGSVENRLRPGAARTLDERTNLQNRMPAGPKPSYVVADQAGSGAPAVVRPNVVRDPENPAFTGYVPPAAPVSPSVPLSSVYGPVARAYQRGGSQDKAVADLNVSNPYIANPKPGLARGAFTNDADYQDYVRTGDWRMADPAAVASLGRAPDSGGGINVRDIVLGSNPFGRAISDVPTQLLRGLGAGQSALDLLTVHADALIPGPGQGTLKTRYDRYVAQGMPPDQAANATMKDYGDALQVLAETDPGNLDSQGGGNFTARIGAQIARGLGLAQSLTAPAPGPGATTIPLVGGFLRKGAKDIATKTAEELAARVAAGEITADFAKKLMQADVSRAPAEFRLASEAANPSVVGRERALIAEAAMNARNQATHITAAEGTGILGGATTQAEVRSAEKRLVELNRERAVQGAPPLTELPPVTHGAGGNDPTSGFQIEKFPPEVQPFLKQMADALLPVLRQTTGTLTHEDIQTAAQMIGKPVSEVANTLAKRGVSSAAIQMVRQGVAVKAKVAMELALKASSGQATAAEKYQALAALQEAATIQASLHEAASEAGRTLGVLRTQIDPALASAPTELAYMAAISRIARSPDHAAQIMDQLLKVGDDPSAIYDILRTLNKPSGWDQVMSLWNLPRAIKASFDLSAAGRQGAILSYAHPRRAAQAFDAQLRAFRNEKTAIAIDNAIRTSPMQPLRDKAGLYLSAWGPGASLSQREEAFLTSLTERIPGMAASGRAYVTYLNKLRADTFDDAILGWQRAGVDVSDARAKLLGDWINIATGRGVFPQWAQGAAPLLNGIFFSPRFAVSRFQAAGFVPTQLAKAGFHAATGQGARAADEIAISKMAAADLVKFTGANMGLLFMASKAGAQVEMDPRSPEFGKMRIGDTVIDPWGGEQQIFRNVAQLITGQKKTVTGKNIGDIVPVARNEVVGRFLESKLAPSAGTIWDLGKLVSKADQTAAEGAPAWDQPIGVDFVGQSFSAKDLLTSTGQGMLIPMSLSDLIDAVAADRAAGGSGLRGAALGSLSFLGTGVTTYGTDTAHGTSPRPSSGSDVSPYHR